MAALFDFFPVLLFVAVYFVGGRVPAETQRLTESLLGGIVQDGAIPTDLAALMLASACAIVAITLQILYMAARRKRIGPALWISFVIFVGFGGATIYFHDSTFIRWKPTAISWIFALTLAGAMVIFKRNFIREMLAPNGISLPDPVWIRLLWGYVGFFALVGAINLYVAFSFSLDTWVSFKLFGVAGLSLLFGIGQTVYLARHLKDEEDDSASSALPVPKQ